MKPAPGFPMFDLDMVIGVLLYSNWTVGCHPISQRNEHFSWPHLWDSDILFFWKSQWSMSTQIPWVKDTLLDGKTLILWEMEKARFVIWVWITHSGVDNGFKPTLNIELFTFYHSTVDLPSSALELRFSS